MPTLFISDLHLEIDRPDIGEQFFAFIENEASHSDALYILGDLFDAGVVIADPSRRGLGAAGVDVLAGTGASTFVLVSCDTGSMGRDVALLRSHGFRVESVTIVDAFPDTSHVETVVGLSR